MRGVTDGDSDFQSTYPVRGAIAPADKSLLLFYLFQSNAPHAGCNLPGNKPASSLRDFNLMHPVRGATHQNNVDLISATISINAPRAGCNRRQG